MRSKKAQITVFLIIAVLILAIFGMVFYIRSLSGIETKKAIDVPDDIAPLYQHVSDCIKDSSTSALYLLGVQGGYINLPDDYLDANYSEIAYSYYESKSSLVSLDTMRSELASFISAAVPLCVDFSAFPDFDITSEDVNVDVDIADDKVFFDVEYPLTVKQGEIVNTIKDFNVHVPVKLGYIHDALSGIVDKTLSDPDYIDMTYLSSFDVKIDILPYNESVLVYSVKDTSLSEEFIFLSAFSYKLNYAPKMKLPDKIEWVDGLPFSYHVEVMDPENDLFTCTDDTAMFDITPDCDILFTPEVPGKYNVTITVEDARGNKNSREVMFIIKED